MIDKLIIQNFKCINKEDLPLAPLTVLAGLNGMGKSTVLQSLLLLQQSYENYRNSVIKTLVLNGNYINIGSAKDALWEGAKDDRLSLGVNIGNESFKWEFDYKEGDDELKVSEEINSKLPTGYGLFSSDFYYLRAERQGPKASFPLSNTAVKHSNKIGIDGEHASYYLSIFGKDELSNNKLIHKNASSSQLRHQLEAWLCEISPGTRVYTETHSNMDLVSLTYAFTSKIGETKPFRSTNVGFGITYIMPLILRILSAKPGSIILLENPEAHLHPKGQVKMGELLALASNGGVQILVETHSDHVLNGIRLAVHEKSIINTNINLYYFERKHEEGTISTKISNPKIDSDGRIDVWPDGFFDETEKSLRKLLIPSSGSDG